MSAPDTPLKVKHPGAVRVDSARVELRSADVALVELELRSKYAEVQGATSARDPDQPDAAYCPGVWLGATKETLYLDPDQPREEPTAVYLPAFPGWEVYATAWFKSTVRLVLRAPTPH